MEKQIDYLAELGRMCKAHGCASCQIGKVAGVCSFSVISTKIDHLKPIIAAWSAAHPQKTYSQDFFEKFPNAEKCDGSNRPFVCLQHIYGVGSSPCTGIPCADCWNRPMP